MVINTLKHNYYVIHKLMENDTLESFLCYEDTRGEANNSLSDMEKATQLKFRVFRLKDKKLTYQMLPFFMELTKHTVFKDYYDCFSKDGCLMLVFRYHEYPSLQYKLDHERCELRERIEIGKVLLEHILMLDMPDFILYDVLSGENVTVSASMEVFFNYSLNSLAKHEVLRLSDVKQRLAVLYEQLFDYELKREASSDIEDFIDDLKTQDYKNYFEIYRKYDELYQKLLSGDLIQRLKPNTFLFRLWDKIKGLGKFIKPVVSVIIVILIAGYLIYTIMHKKVDAAAVIDFKQIGTVMIQGGTDDQAAETENAGNK